MLSSHQLLGVPSRAPGSDQWEAEAITEPEPRRGRFLHRHPRRRAARPSSAHVADAVRPSPARAEPHDATAWLPLPQIDGLPSVDDLLAGAPDDTLPTRDVPVGLPSPARAAPHDATAWLPLPELEELPPIDDLLVPDPDVAPPAPRDVPVGLPSPARAEPHDATAWLPLPDVEGLPALEEMVEGDGETAPPGRGRSHRRVRIRHLPIRSTAIVLAVLATLSGGYYGVSRLFDPGADVELRVDGRSISSQTGVSTVGSFLKERHVTLGPHDRVDPGPKVSIENGMVVRVLRAFPVAANLDGADTTFYTTRRDPKAFLTEQGLTRIGFRDAPKRITKETKLVLRRIKRGTLLVDGQNVQYNAPAYTVAELLEDYKVVLGPNDVTSTGGNQADGRPPGPIGANDVLPDATAIAVVRVATETIPVDEVYTLPDVQQPDPNVMVDAPVRIVPGKAGVQKVTYAIQRHNGAEVGRAPISYIPVDPAKATIIYFGAKYDPRWDKIAQCETGSNWSHKGSGAAGPNTYQGGVGIWYRNWTSQGGTEFAPTADQATKYQQIIIAMRIQKKFGWSAWGCGKTLGYAKEDGKRTL